jgi:folate-binding protein YgfZ
MSTGAKLSLLAGRAAIRVSGADWRSFLQGLLTQDVETLAPGELRYGALLAPQGRLLYDLFLLGQADGEGVLLDVAAEAREALLQKLALYRLRAKVDIAPAEARVFALWDTDIAPGGWAPDPRLPELGWRAVADGMPPAGGAQTVDEAAYEAHRLALNVPDGWRDGLHDRAYPIEANLDLLGGIDFKKGCFVGQETTSRMKRRGPVRTRMTPIAFDGPAPARGAEVLAGELRAGEVTGAQAGLALALVRLDRLHAGPLTVEGRPARALPPEWLPLPAEGGEDD